MKTRIITAIIMTAVLIPFFIFSDTAAFTVLIAFLAGMGAFEMYRCIGQRSRILLISGVIYGAALPFAVRYLSGLVLQFYIFFMLSFVLIIFMFSFSMFSGGKLDPEKTGVYTSMLIYSVFGFSSILLLRDNVHGWYYVFLPFVISWMTDTFAYFTGMLFGKHKLIPLVSPKKTVEGAVGGTVFAVMLTVLYSFIYSKAASSSPNYIFIAIVALICSVCSQIGDLIMSYVKRKYGIKDYGKLLPGHGGVLDRFDSIIIVSGVLTILTMNPYVPFILMI